MLSSSLFYDAIAHTYDKYCETAENEEVTEVLIDIILDLKPTSILEFGIGTGRFAKRLLDHLPSSRYSGVDSSGIMLSKNTLPVKLYHDDIISHLLLHLKKRKKTVDLIVAPYTEIHHLTESGQNEFLTLAGLVAKNILIVSLSEQEETFLFKKKNTETTVSFPDTHASTTVYKVSKTLRKNCQLIQRLKHHDILKM